MPTTKKQTEEVKVETKTKSEKNFDGFKKALSDLDKEFKKGLKSDDGFISLLPEMASANTNVISSGSIVLDSIAGGGIPEGRIVEIYGPEASGKTSIALNLAANVQRNGGTAVFIDVEQALDIRYASVLGVDINKLGFSQLSIAEEVLHACEKLADSGQVNIIVVDSVAQMIPRKEFEEDIEKQTIGLMARVFSKGLRKLTPIAKRNNCTIIFLNQTRDKVGVMFGNPETTPGGKALKFAASQRIEVRKVGVVKDGTDIIGTEVKLKIVKNKIAPPFGEGKTILSFAKGINRAAEILETGVDLGLLEKSGNTHYYNPTTSIKLTNDNLLQDDGRIKLGTSKSTAIKTLEEEKELFENVIEKLKIILKNRLENVIPEEIEKQFSQENEKDIFDEE